MRAGPTARPPAASGSRSRGGSARGERGPGPLGVSAGASAGRAPIRVAREEEIAEVAAVLAQAFEDDPLHRHFLPDDDRRGRCLARSFELYLRGHLGKGPIHVPAGGGGAAAWAAPGAWEDSLGDVVRALPEFARIFGLRRLPAIWRAWQRVEARHPKDPPHWYLFLLGVDPRKHGRGLASALVRPMLERCDQESLPAYLETATHRNLAIYRRFGFEVREAVDIRHGPRVWCMWREPGSG
jgi:ribosomal protein S18 acetylase RimI-like enzyme